MKEQPSKPQKPDPENWTDSSDAENEKGIWNRISNQNQEWKDAPVVKDEEGIWNEAPLIDQEWKDAPVDDEAKEAVWDKALLANQEWVDAPVDKSEEGIWNEAPILNQDWIETPVDESEEAIWHEALPTSQEWQDVAVDKGEEGVWVEVAPVEQEWKDAPLQDEKEEKKKEGMVYLPKIIEEFSYPLVPLLGYGFLGLSFAEHVNIIYPVKLAEPLWIVETLGSISERIPIIWLGLVLVLFRTESYTRKWEIWILKFVSWLSLFLAISYLAMTPMLVGNTVRIYQLVDTQITARYTDQVEKIRSSADKVIQSPDEQISNFLASRNEQKSVQQFREEAKQRVTKSLDDLRLQTDIARESQLAAIVGKTTKWSFGNIVSAFVCAFVWYSTRWVRNKNLQSSD